MKHTNAKSSQSGTSANPTTLNLQTRPFAPIQADSDQDDKVTDGVPPQSRLASSENILARLIATPKTEPSATPIRRKAFPSMRMPIQAKLNIGEPNDKYEKEADNTAAKVVQQINSSPQDSSVQKQETEEDELQMKPAISTIQREEGMEEDDELQMKSLMQRRENLGGGEASTDLESSIQSARGSGQSLDSNLQAKMGQAMGADFSGVKVHTDSQSDQLNQSVQAKAFTTGQDVFFRQGEYNPSSKGGQELIAHELTHVVQQTGGADLQMQGDIEGNGDGHGEKNLLKFPIQRVSSISSFIQRASSAVQKEIFKEKAKEYEFKLGYALSKAPLALDGAKALTDKLQELILATGNELQDSYAPERTSTGRVDKSRIAEVFASGNLRERMGTIYAFITNYQNEPHSLGGLLKSAMQSEESMQNIGLNKELWQSEQGDNFTAFNRKGKVADKKVNDRQQYTQKESSKNLEAFFNAAPTPNKVIERGEVALSSRELESSFPSETNTVRQKTGNEEWNLLAENERQTRYLEAVGNKSLSDWKGGEFYNKLGPKLKEEENTTMMRMVAGFSGTTDMYLHLADYLSLGKPVKEKVRLASLGTMIPIRDHSFHEIMTASTSYGLDYNSGPEGYANVPPLAGNPLKTLVDVSHFPHEYLSEASTSRLAAETSDPDVAKVPTLPKRSSFVAPSKASTTYKKILDTLDRYHAASPVERYPIADLLVQAIDAWVAKDKWFKGDTKKKINDLRNLATQCGMQVAKSNKNLLDLEGDSAIARLTYMPDDDQIEPGLLATTPELAEGMSGKSATAFERLGSAIKQAARTPEVQDPTTLPETSDSTIYKQLRGSDDFVALSETTGEENGSLMLRVFIKSCLGGRLVRPSKPTDVDYTNFQKVQSGLARVTGNFGGIAVQIDGGLHPRQGLYKVSSEKTPVERAVAKKKLLNLGYKLTPLELDVIDGYTGNEYGSFTSNEASPERRNALISALKKLPKASGPLYRGDYAYTNAGKSASTKYRKGVTNKITFSSTSKSLTDSFVPKRTTAHVYLNTKSAADIEAFSKKTWEQEALMPPTTVKCVGVVDKSKESATFENNTLTGKGGLPTIEEQESQMGNGSSVGMRLELGAGEEQWQKWYTEKFKNKVWIFWEEV